MAKLSKSVNILEYLEFYIETTESRDWDLGMGRNEAS